jgi:rhodanese-related sulfurtransferase
MEQLTEFITNHPYLWVAFFTLLALFIYSEITGKNSGSSDVSPIDATQLINHQNAILLDIRDAKERSEGSIVNSTHIPLAELEKQMAKLEKHKDKAIIAYCRSGQRSATACKQLRKHGYNSVYNLKGGIMAWQRDNLPLIKE